MQPELKRFPLINFRYSENINRLSKERFFMQGLYH